MYVRKDSYREHNGSTVTARLSRKMLLDTHCLYSIYTSKPSSTPLAAVFCVVSFDHKASSFDVPTARCPLPQALRIVFIICSAFCCRYQCFGIIVSAPCSQCIHLLVMTYTMDSLRSYPSPRHVHRVSLQLRFYTQKFRRREEHLYTRSPLNVDMDSNSTPRCDAQKGPSKIASPISIPGLYKDLTTKFSYDPADLASAHALLDISQRWREHVRHESLRNAYGDDHFFTSRPGDSAHVRQSARQYDLLWPMSPHYHSKQERRLENRVGPAPLTVSNNDSSLSSSQSYRLAHQLDTRSIQSRDPDPWKFSPTWYNKSFALPLPYSLGGGNGSPFQGSPPHHLCGSDTDSSSRSSNEFGSPFSPIHHDMEVFSPRSQPLDVALTNFRYNPGSNNAPSHTGWRPAPLAPIGSEVCREIATVDSTPFSKPVAPPSSENVLADRLQRPRGWQHAQPFVPLQARAPHHFQPHPQLQYPIQQADALMHQQRPQPQSWKKQETPMGPSPNNPKAELYKTELCRNWEELGSCFYRR